MKNSCRTKKILLVLPLLFTALLLPAASSAFFVLDKGPVPSHGVPSLSASGLPVLTGEYVMESDDRKMLVPVYLTAGYIPFQAEQWKVCTALSGRKIWENTDGSFFCQLDILNPNESMASYRYWTVFFDFSQWTGLLENRAAMIVFMELFLNRFEYFASLVKMPEDVSFPAVLKK